MPSKLLLPAFIGLSVALFACDRVASHEDDANRAAPADTAAAADAVKQVEANMLAAFKARDSAKIASYYADDAVAATPGRDAQHGVKAIGEAMAGDLKDPGFSVDFTNEKTDVAASGDMAYTSGTFHVTFTDPKTKKAGKEAGSYVTVFRKQADGNWKAVADYAVPGAPAG